MKSHKYIRKENKDGKVRYIYTERDITTQNKGDGERLGAKQIGSKRAGSRYEKALEFFIRRRSSQTGSGTSRENQETERREENKGDFIEYCKDNGLWIESLPEMSSSNFLDKGMETNVYNYGKDKVLKQITLSQHEHLDNPIEDLLQRIAYYNYVFEESGLELVGFGEFDFEGEKQFSVLVTQERFDDFEPVLRDEVKKFMEKKGFKHDKGNTYYNSHFIVDDLHADNVVKRKGEYFVLDCFIEDNTEQGWKKIEGEI